MASDTPEVTRTRWLSIRKLVETARRTFERFPLVILSGIAAALVFHHLLNIDFDSDEGADNFWPIAASCVLGISLFFALRIMGESRDWPRRWRLGASLFGLTALVVYYVSLPVPMKEADVFRFFLLAAGLHFWVAFAPFARRSSEANAFWQYNRVLFLRFALAALYSSVLYVGLALALVASDNLLGLDWYSEIYGQLWFWIAFAYNTWFFLAGIPQDVRRLEHVQDYPTGLRIFTQYVLIPLVVVYLVILYAYLGKIIVEWNLPKGWVGYPVIGVAVAGVLALLLVHPTRERAENAWIVTYSKFFYWALFPLIALMAVAIWTRIADYGITEKRYTTVVATLWLFGIALYFSLKGSSHIRILPISLCALAFATAIGPWGAVAFSWRSQVGRLQELLITNEVLVAGALDSTAKLVEFEQEKEIGAILKYLYDTHGLGGIHDLYAQPERLPDDLDYRTAMREMGLEYRQRWEQEASFSISVEPPNPLLVTGFDYSYRLFGHFGDEQRLQATLDGALELRLENTTLHLQRSGESEASLSVDLGPMIRSLEDMRQRGVGTDASDASLEAENENFRMLVYMEAASGSMKDEALELSHLNALVLIGLR